MRLVLVLALIGCQKQEPTADSDGVHEEPTLCDDVGGLALGLSGVRTAGQSDLDEAAGYLDDLGIRHIRIGENWIYREEERGIYTWDGLDMRLQWAEDNGYAALLLIESRGPSWACDPAQTNEASCVFAEDEPFRAYVEAIAERYSDRIPRVQFGNEWAGGYNYVGSVEDYAKFYTMVYDAFEQHSPDTSVSLGGLSAGMSMLLAVCDGLFDSYTTFDDDGNIYEYDADAMSEFCTADDGWPIYLERMQTVFSQVQTDAIDIHLYDDVERWEIYVDNIRAQSWTDDVPVIASEFGGPNLALEDYSDDYHAQQVEKYIRALGRAGVEEAYHHSLDSSYTMWFHEESGLLDDDGEQKPAYEVYQQAASCSVQ